MPLLRDALLVLFMGYVYYLGQIAIHNCVHYTLFKRKRLNRLVGMVLCSVQLTHFDGWRAAHMMHHRFTNTERDPHRVDRHLLPYLATHYYRIARRTWEPARFFAAVLPPVLLAAAVVAWSGWNGDLPGGVRLVSVFWLLPMIIGHLLVAHFNFITHAELPYGRGHDTRSFNDGIWRVINLFTFNFYLHAEHHLDPGEAIPTYRPQLHLAEPATPAEPQRTLTRPPGSAAPPSAPSRSRPAGGRGRERTAQDA
jgi:fatty acid desaturase